MTLEVSEEVQWYMDNKLVHSIHTSSRRAFRACRRRWDWTNRQMYYPLTTPEPLEFGIAFHKAMETFYEPMTWTSDRNVRRDLALVAFSHECQQHMKKYKELNEDPDVLILESYKTRRELGLNMLRYYCDTVSPLYDNNWTPIRVEVAFEVPIKDPDTGQQLWCKCEQCWIRFKNYHLEKGDGTYEAGSYQFKKRWNLHTEYQELTDFGQDFWKSWDGLPVTYGGRLDGLMQDSSGRYWIVDWKQLPYDEKILTPAGWSTMGEMKVGSQVIGSDGQAITVLGVYPKGKHEVYEMEFLDGTVVECSADHLWQVKSTHFGYTKVLEAREIMNKPSYERYAVQLVSEPIEFIEQDEELLLHPYVLGSLIGDGCFTQSTLTYSSQSGETVELLKKYSDANTEIIDQRWHGDGHGNRWQINGSWRSKLKQLGLYSKRAAEKFIPKQYLFASVENRILLLQGLCDTDGNTGLYRFTTTSQQLAEDFRHLVWSLGGTAMLNNSKERLHQNGHTINVAQYGVNYWLPERIEPNQLERKRVGRTKRIKGKHRSIKEVRATGVMKEMQCIRVDAPDNLYVTRNFILTHNTTSRLLDEDAEASFLQLDDQIVSYLWALEQYGIHCAGFVYVEIKKNFPQAPERLTRLYKGRSFSTNKDFLTTYDMALATFQKEDPDAWQMGLYDDYLIRLKSEGPRFTQRHQIHKNPHEIREAGRVIALEAMDMTDQNLRIYPQPGRFSCNWCLFKQPCLGQNMGEDYQYTLNTLFEKRDRMYWELKEASTD